MTLNIREFPALGASRGILVAIPGLSESAATLTVTCQHWAERGFRVLSIDPRGHGQSPRWNDDLLRAHPGDVIVEDILGTLDERLGHVDQPLVFFGHSAGGSAAAAVAAMSERSVSGLVLEDPFWRLPVTRHQDPRVAENAGLWLSEQQRLSDAEREADAAALYPRWPHDELAEWSKSKAEMDLALVRHGDVIPSRPWPQLLEDMRERGIPVLMITGTLRCGNTPAHRAIQRKLGVRVEIFEGASHFVRRDERSRFHHRVDVFLDEILPPLIEAPTGASASRNR